MAAFTVRVELHGDPTWDDYDTLHTAMEAAGFRRTITDSHGVERHLPTAEYNLIGQLDKYDVLGLARTAAITTGKDHSILVTESKGRTWHNLEPVEPV